MPELPGPCEVLCDCSERLPDWLASYQPGEPFPRRAFFASRIVYYPGSRTDGHPLRVFGRSCSAHCFVYADKSAEVCDVARKELTDEADRGHPAGYRLIHMTDLTSEEVLPRDWVSHFDVPGADKTISSRPFACWAVLERMESVSVFHGADRLSILHVFHDAYHTFDALFCQRGRRLPYAVLLHDHGYGGNWGGYRFGAAESPLWQLVRAKGGQLPKWLLVAENTDGWPGYVRVSGPDYGGMCNQPRCLYIGSRRTGDAIHFGHRRKTVSGANLYQSCLSASTWAELNWRGLTQFFNEFPDSRVVPICHLPPAVM